jgi:hypothetical protein
MSAIDILLKYKAIRYDTTNRAEIQALVTNTALVSESGGVLVLESPSGSSTWTINTNDWVVYTQNMITGAMSQSAFDFFYIRNAVYDDVTDLQEAIGDLQAIDALLSAGVKECPLLVVGNTTVAVDIIPAMPNTGYTPRAELFASVALLGSLSISSVAVVDVNTVNVVITNGGLVSLTGANVLVTVTA